MLTEVNKKVANNYVCSICHYNTSRKSSYDKHLLTSKHNKLTKSCTKVANKYTCLFCDYTTSQKSMYDKHLITPKHIELTTVNTKVAKSCKNIENDIIICDICDKTYKSRVGLWKHKKTCCVESKSNKRNINNDNNDNDNKECEKSVNKEENSMSDKDIIMYLLKENTDFKNMMMKMVENGIHNDNSHHNNNNNITNCNNKAFNLNFFLNETCKNAMNMSDFVDSLQLQLSDLESIGDLGYVEGISKIILKNLKAFDETERPIHCTDKKRETFYVKNDDKWEKDDENKTCIRKTIKYIADKNTYLIPEWKLKYPDYLDSSSHYSDKYNNLIIEVLGGDEDSSTSENKIIRKIAKEVIIEKNNEKQTINNQNKSEKLP